MTQRQEATKQAIRLERQTLTQERNAELRAYHARVEAQTHERVQVQVAGGAPETAKVLDLTTEANRAFGIPIHEQEITSGEGSQRLKSM